jgi:hypothetical protein
VIELEATEVARAPAGSPAAEAQEPPVETAGTPAAATPAAEPEPRPAPAYIPPAPERPEPFIPPVPERPLRAAFEPSRPEAQAGESPPPPPPPEQSGASSSSAQAEPKPRLLNVAWLPPDFAGAFSWPMVAAGAAGAAGVLLAFLLLWLVGAMPGSRDSTAALTPRLAAIDGQLRELAARPVPPGVDPRPMEEMSARLAKLEAAVAAPRPVPPGVDPKTIEDVAARLAKLETAVAAPRPAIDPKVMEDLSARFARLEAAVAAPRPPVADPGVLGRLTSTETAVKSLNDNMTALLRRGEQTAAALAELQTAARTSTADHGEIAALAGRVAALERADKALADELAKRTIAATQDRAVRLAVATATLRTAVERGDPFALELAAVKSLAADARPLAALEPFAASGVPGAAALSRELAALIQPMSRLAVPVARNGGILDRLQANAEKLVRVRPVDEAPGDDPAAVIARVEARAAQSDIAGALAELAKLPAPVRAPAQPWIARAEARNAAVEAARRLSADAVAGLKTAP